MRRTPVPHEVQVVIAHIKERRLDKLLSDIPRHRPRWPARARNPLTLMITMENPRWDDADVVRVAMTAPWTVNTPFRPSDDAVKAMELHGRTSLFLALTEIMDFHVNPRKMLGVMLSKHEWAHANELMERYSKLLADGYEYLSWMMADAPKPLLQNAVRCGIYGVVETLLLKGRYDDVEDVLRKAPEASVVVSFHDVVSLLVGVSNEPLRHQLWRHCSSPDVTTVIALGPVAEARRLDIELPQFELMTQHLRVDAIREFRHKIFPNTLSLPMFFPSPAAFETISLLYEAGHRFVEDTSLAFGECTGPIRTAGSSPRVHRVAHFEGLLMGEPWIVRSELVVFRHAVECYGGDSL
jgi:hypothetical protein